MPVASTYRVAWRRMAATTGFRTLYPALIPPGTQHVNGVLSAGPITASEHVFAAAGASSILSDFFIRASGSSDLYGRTFDNLPLAVRNHQYDSVVRSFLRLNCLTEAYSALWEGITGETWTPEVPIRSALARAKALTSLDVFVGSSLGISADELRMIYRTQFPVMSRYDQESVFDKNGRQLPKTILKAHLAAPGESKLSIEERTWTHPASGVTYLFEYPFQSFDRELELSKQYFELTGSNYSSRIEA